MLQRVVFEFVFDDDVVIATKAMVVWKNSLLNVENFPLKRIASLLGVGFLKALL